MSCRAIWLFTATFAAPALLWPQEPSAETLASRARSILEKGAADKDPETRREVAIALSLGANDDAAVALLRALVNDQDYRCREAAITTVSQMADPKLASLIRPALRDKVPEVMFAAARALYQLDDPAGEQALIEILEGEERAESNFFAGQLREMARRLKTPKSALLFVAEQGVGFAPVPGLGLGYYAMTNLLTQADFSPRATALLLLSSRSPNARAMVQRAFRDENWSMRAAAVQITASWNEQTLKPYLVPLFNDSNKKVRYRAPAVYLRLDYSERRTQ